MDEKLITWLDVERQLKKVSKNKTNYPDFIQAVFCYNSSMEIEYSGELLSILEWLGSIFGRKLSVVGQPYIRLDLNKEQYPIEFIQSANTKKNQKLVYPLWKEHVYNPGVNVNTPEKWSDGPHVTSFHSFKGGVGRTTSLMTYATAVLNSKERAKVLLIDADLEAPGISFWLDDENKPTVSFINYVEAIHYSPSAQSEVINYFANELRKSSINIDGPSKEIFVLPSSLDLTSVMDMPVTPEHLSKNLDNPWVLSEYLMKLGKVLEVDVVLIDLRAGLSELASPIIFDPRIEHYFVTTVAPQSVKGMCEVLSRLNSSNSTFNFSTYSKEKPSVIVSLLTNQLRKLPAYTLATEMLNSAYPTDDSDILAQGIEWLEVDFNQSLMSLSSIRSAYEALPHSTLYDSAKDWAKSLSSSAFDLNNANGHTSGNKNISDAQKLRDTCSKFQFAENIDANDMLVTDPLRNFAKYYTDTLPNAVSIGAKGAGKTFTYIQICLSGNWGNFHKKINTGITSTVDAVVFPLLASTNLDAASEKVRSIRKQSLIKLGLKSETTLDSASKKVKAALDTADTNWDEFWIDFLLSELGGECNSLQELNEQLASKNQSLLLLVDGIEDLFDSPDAEEIQRGAIKALLQLPNALSEIPDRKIGLICFIRADYVQTVIKQNFSQFVSRYQPFRLEWTPESFLRLAYWVAGKSAIINANPNEADKLNSDNLLTALEKLWGKKLGRDNSKEANSARWVFAAICDLNGKLQARDIVRFLKFSAEAMLQTQSSTIKPEVWVDRILAPEAIRKSLPACSQEKVSETASEIKSLNDWLAILKTIPKEVKKVPFNPLEVGLSLELLNSLKELGIIYEDTDQNSEDRYFLPEIYRWGLNFTSSGGGRPRVQALLKRNLGGIPF
ncbi:AAA family ATPase [Klebsiella pneumoniae]|uniref:ParA family protein n=4 Tax=Klebsiella TaxID=570 RepID=UPI002EB2DCB6|nr:AAA family ATPase [Klebsiella pneumoniae]HBY4592948.1 ParA family protein [Klebsiella pneumoniae]